MINETSLILWRATEEHLACAPLTKTHPTLSVDDAYTIQLTNIERRLDAGARVVGRKVGLTSEAVQSWLGVDEPDFGTLLDTMSVDDGGKVPTERLLQPRAEGEIAFVMQEELRGPGLTAADVMRATGYIVPAIEIIDSRIDDWKIKYVDTIADNASSGMFVLGSSPVALDSLAGKDWTLFGMRLRKNGTVVSTGCGAACLGHPINAVVWLANKLGEMGTSIGRGEVVLSGALGPVTDVGVGDWVEVDIAHVGHVSVRF